MPCDVNTAMHHHAFNHVLSCITMYCLQTNVKYCIIGGDFNTDISRVNSMNTTSLQNFDSDESLMFWMKSENCINIDYTYCGPNQAFSVIDHFIISRCLSSSIAVYKTISSMSNISDHVPLFLDVEWHSSKITNIFDPITDQILNPLWARVSQAQIEHYQSRFDFYLSKIVISYTALLCKDFSCSVSSHKFDLDLFYQNIIEACVFATNDAIPCRNLSRPRDKHKHFPGWTPELNLAREQLLFWHFIWDACERPQEDEVADVILRHARNHYHYSIRRIKKNGDLAVRRSIGNALLCDPSRYYWTEVKKIHKNKSCIQNKVDDKTGSVDIANAFAD